MKITENLGLQKPDPSETFDIEHSNTNMDIIDEFAVITKADLAKLLERYNSEADWIIEHKTEGDWEYRKWNSGFFEGWYRHDYGAINFDTAIYASRLWKNSSYYPLRIDPPITLVNIKDAQAGWKNNSWVINVCYNMNTYVGIYLGNLSSGSADSNICDLYIAGRWK